MKNIFLAIIIVSSIGLICCDNDELDNIKKEVMVVQDSLDMALDQHNRLLDSISTIIKTINKQNALDTNALKISQIGILFESIARNRSVAQKLIDITEILYFDYTKLLPFSNKTIIGRGNSLGHLFAGIARWPKVHNKLDSVATKFLGKFNHLNMSDDYTEGEARGIALKALFIATSRQPKAYNILEAKASKFLGNYNPSYFSNKLIGVSKTFAMEGLVYGLARQPEADSLFNIICIKFLNFKFLNKNKE